MMGYRVLMYVGGLLCALVYLANAAQVRALRHDAEELETELEQGDLGQPGVG